ncbi:MAG: BCCT family transporter, partial [Coriobacteriaceae bacterium]|nr:BCCT family transporter [Coriobacteriaceae bacterium]
SKGRTIREFIGGVVVVPAVASILWFGVFGSMGLSLGINGEVSMDTLASIAAAPETGLFTILPHYFGGFALCVVALVLLLTFFITSANSGTFVLGMLSSDGDMNPTSAKKILWGAIQAAMAIGLLIAGGLKPVQTISIVAAAPFIIVMFAVMVSIVKALAKDPAVTGEVDQAEEPKAIEAEGAAETV